MSDFFELPEGEEYEGLWKTDKARCKCCGYEWQAVAPEDTKWLECPLCEKMCGVFKDS